MAFVKANMLKRYEGLRHIREVASAWCLIHSTKVETNKKTNYSYPRQEKKEQDSFTISENVKPFSAELTSSERIYFPVTQPPSFPHAGSKLDKTAICLLPWLFILLFSPNPFDSKHNCLSFPLDITLLLYTSTLRFDTRNLKPSTLSNRTQFLVLPAIPSSASSHPTAPSPQYPPIYIHMLSPFNASPHPPHRNLTAPLQTESTSPSFLLPVCGH